VQDKNLVPESRPLQDQRRIPAKILEDEVYGIIGFLLQWVWPKAELFRIRQSGSSPMVYEALHDLS